MSHRFHPILLVSAANIIYSHKPDNLSNMCLMPQAFKNDPEPRVSIYSSDIAFI